MKQKQQNTKLIFKKLWNKAQDDVLKSIISTQTEYKWSNISSQFNLEMHKIYPELPLLTRTNKQCRQRWQNHLNPKLNNTGQWSKEEHEELFNLFQLYSHQWSIIGCKLQEKGFPRRGDNNVKNYFYSNIKRGSKRINQVIRENNKQIKRMKSLAYNYNEKYTYKKRMSLQRQILKQQHPNQEPHSQRQEQHQLYTNELRPDQDPSQHANQPFRIIKELQPKIINKIFQIKEERNQRKFTIGHVDSKQINKVRSKMISFLKNFEALQKSELIDLSRQILDISRQYKRKGAKINGKDEADEMDYENDSASIKQEELKVERSRKQIFWMDAAVSPQTKQVTIIEKCTEERKFEQKEINRQIPFEFVIPKNIPFIANQYSSPRSLYPIKNQYKDQQAQKRQNNALFNQLFGDNRKNILEQSNEFMYASNHFFIKTAIQDPLNSQIMSNKNSFQNSTLFYGELNQSSNYPFPSKSNDLFKSISQEFNSREKGLQNYTNRGQWSFINTIKEVKPVHNNQFEHQFDFGNSFTPLSFRNNEAEQNLFFSQLVKKSKPSYSLLSNQSKSKTNQKSLQKNQERERQFQLGNIPFENLMQSQMHRSWGYSQNKIDINRNNLFNSNNFEQTRKDNPLDFAFKHSNFTPYQKPEQ